MDIPSSRPGSLEQQMLMDDLGIRRMPSDVYHYRNCRYTNLEDAIAQARRDREG